MSVRTKRVYDPAAVDDGYRVLIDRLWPRGLSKERARLDECARELAPSDELRRWFDHRPERFDRFRRLYTDELRDHADRISDARTQGAFILDRNMGAMRRLAAAAHPRTEPPPTA